MFRTGAIGPAIAAAPSRDAPVRRLACGLLLSLLVHAFILSLQFGLPGMAMQGVRPAINVTLAPTPPMAEPQPQPVAPEPLSSPPATELRPPVHAGGMTVVDPQARPAPAPPVRPRQKPRKARRVSTPLAAPDAVPRPRVITQDSNPDSDFAVPVPQPAEAVQKTIDPAEAQHGSDEAAAVEEAPQPAAEPEQPALAARVEQEEQLRLEAARLAAEQQRLAAQAAARERELMEQQRLAQQAAERRRADELLAQQRRDGELVERQRMEELLTRQRLALEQAERQRIAQEQAERARVAQEAGSRQRAREQAERQRLDELAAQRLAQEAARQQSLRQREPAQAAPAPAGDPFGLAEGQGGSGRARGAAGNYGSDLANRVRDLSKGLDLLAGAPPARTRSADENQQRRVVADSAERDVPLRMYVESWRQKIERNGSMNFPKGIGDRARIDPLVSVALRSDGSIEDVTIVRSSGRPDTDEAVRRIVRINALYAKFPPNVAARYDVIEIRRVWTFDQVLKLIEEVR